jgi:hypothetical protein
MEDLLDHSARPPGRTSIPLGLYAWFLVATLGLWFIVREANPKEIRESWVLYPAGFAAVNWLACEWGRICGRIFEEWWGGYMLVFISVALVTGVAWWFLGEQSMNDLWRSNPSAIWTVNATERSNIAGLLFVFLILPAFYGAYWSERTIK